MTEPEVRTTLSALLAERHPGFVLHILAELLSEAADEYLAEEPETHAKLMLASNAVLVLARGVDLTLPHGSQGSTP